MKKPKLNDKLTMCQLLMKNSILAGFIPETRILNKQNLVYLMDKYNKIVVKPSFSSLGKGVIIIEDMGNERYNITTLNRTNMIIGLNPLLNFLRKKNSAIPNIAQRHIKLAEVAGNPTDFRYIIQKDQNGWKITGFYARVAQKGYSVTNFDQGATILTVENALIHSNIKNTNVKFAMENLDSITLEIAKCLEQQFKNHSIWGCDLAIDEDGSFWIIEVNSAPQTKGFLELEELVPMYKQIEAYKRKGKSNRKKGHSK